MVTENVIVIVIKAACLQKFQDIAGMVFHWDSDKWSEQYLQLIFKGMYMTFHKVGV